MSSASITPGTLTEDDHLDARASNFLAALAMVRHGETDFALAWADVSTGETFSLDLSAEVLQDELARIDPAELLMTDATRLALLERHLLPPNLAGVLSTVAPDLFDSEAAAARLRAAFPADMFDPTAFTRAARSALGALVAYVDESQKGRAVALRPPVDRWQCPAYGHRSGHPRLARTAPDPARPEHAARCATPST